MKFFFVCLLCLLTNLAAKTQNILILSSYHKGFEVSDTMIKNIEEVLYFSIDVKINVLYMDSKEIHSRDYIQELSNLYSLQLKNRSFDLIITIDKFAYLFALKNYHILFNNEPILFTGIENYSKELIEIYNMQDKIHGLVKKLHIKDNIELMLKSMPALKKIYIINDRSINAEVTSPFIIRAKRDFIHRIKIDYLRDDTLAELKENFSKKRKDEAILFVRFTNDINGRFYTSKEVKAAIKNFKLPVFVTDSLFLNEGVIGGKTVSYMDLGKRTANKTLIILNNASAKPMINEYKDFFHYFDANEVEKYALKLPSNLKNLKIINVPQNFFEKHRSLINWVFLFTPFLLMIIFALLNALKEKQIAARKLKQRVEFDKLLLNAIESPIFWQDENGIILDANARFCELVDITYFNLKGARLDGFISHYPRAYEISSFLIKNKLLISKGEKIYAKDLISKKNIYLISQTSYQSVDNGSGTVTIFTDVTKEKEREEEKIKHVQYMIQQSKLAEIGEVFSSIAHQWKSPLVEITALAQDMFYSGNHGDKEEDSYHINNIMIQAKYMTDTINDFQDFIMPSKEKTSFNVFTTIESMLNIVKHNMKYNYIDIKLDVNPSSNLFVYGYENEFMQAILNIVNNAKEALLYNEKKNRELKIVFKNQNGQILIYISDNGPGIASEDHKNIFRQYFSTKEIGNGIGLYMTRLIIEDKLLGEISCLPCEIGSKFLIKLKAYNETISA